MLYQLELSYACFNKKTSKTKLELTFHSLGSYLLPPSLLEIKSEDALMRKCLVRGHMAHQWYKLQQEPSASINTSQRHH